MYSRAGSNDDPWLYFIYDSSWRAVASVFAVDNGSGTESGEYLAKADDDPRELFVFHTAGVAGRGTASKLDDVILRDRDFNVGAWGAAGDGTCEQRTYYAQNWRGDVVATLDSTGARRESIRYSTYGLPFGIASGDVDGSGSVVAGDASAVNAQIGKSFGVSGYTVLLDVDLDGDVDVNDYNVSNGQSGLTLGHSALSAAPTTADGGNRMGYAGYAWEPVSSKYAVRHRVFDPLRGRWSRRDPVGYVDSPTLYSYVSDRAMTAIDPMGLRSIPPVACPPGAEYCKPGPYVGPTDQYGKAGGDAPYGSGPGSDPVGTPPGDDGGAPTLPSGGGGGGGGGCRGLVWIYTFEGLGDAPDDSGLLTNEINKVLSELRDDHPSTDYVWKAFRQTLGEEQAAVPLAFADIQAHPRCSSSMNSNAFGQFVVIGFSNGGGAAISFAERLFQQYGFTVSLLVTIDPIPRFGFADNMARPPGASRMLNYYQDADPVLNGHSIPGADIDHYETQVDHGLGAHASMPEKEAPRIHAELDIMMPQRESIR